MLCSCNGRTFDQLLFGSQGAGFWDQSNVEVGNAIIKGFAPENKARKDLEFLLEKAIISPVEVTEVFTSVRAQTSIDPLTGSAEEKSLRFLRALNPGLEFSAIISLNDDAMAPVLSVVAGTVRRIGISRTRGYGEVKMSLLDSNGLNLTQKTRNKAADKKGLTSIIESMTKKPEKDTSLPLTEEREDHGQDKHLLRYRLQLKKEALLPKAGADPNSMKSLTYLSGKTLQGAFATKFPCLHNRNNPPEKDNDFRQIILQGGVYFLNAYPAAKDDSNMRLLPTPHSMRKDKVNEQSSIDLAHVCEPENPVQRMEGTFLKFGYEPEVQEVDTSFHYHHARSVDRRFGRALGSEIDGGGALFTYESLKAGQTFIGGLRGSVTNLSKLQEILPSGSTLRIGRSRTAQYGGMAALEWIDHVPVLPSSKKPEWNSWKPTQNPTNESGNSFMVTCLSPLIGTNAMGHPAPVFPLEELAAALEINSELLEIKQCWTRTKIEGTFHQHLRLPGLQQPAIAEGSVFRISIRGEPDVTEQLAILEQEGLGSGRDAGYGRIAVNLHGSEGKFQLRQFEPVNSQSRHDLQPLNKQNPMTALMISVLLSRALRKARLDAVRMAHSAANLGNIPSSSTLNRIITLLRADDWNTKTLDLYNEFKERAKKQFKTCQIRNPRKDRDSIQSLDHVIQEYLEDRVTVGKEYFSDRISRGGQTSLLLHLQDRSHEELQITEDQAMNITQTFLINLFSELTYCNRTKQETDNDDE